MQCYKCGAPVIEGDLFCPNCGASLMEKEKENRICEKGPIEEVSYESFSSSVETTGESCASKSEPVQQEINPIEKKAAKESKRCDRAKAATVFSYGKAGDKNCP